MVKSVFGFTQKARKVIDKLYQNRKARPNKALEKRYAPVPAVNIKEFLFEIYSSQLHVLL